jgi:hypothetical protein
MKFFMVCLLALLPIGLFAQTPEDACKGAGDWWYDDTETCYSVAAMDTDEIFLWSKINFYVDQKARLQHEQQDYNASNKAIRFNNYNDRITSLTNKMNNTTDQELKDEYQAEIDAIIVVRDLKDAKDVSNHGQRISELSQKIEKLNEELVRYLNQ